MIAPSLILILQTSFKYAVPAYNIDLETVLLLLDILLNILSC